MIQQEYKNNVNSVSGSVVSNGFGIEANASVYAMLTSDVYNDPKKAVVREWSTNACDSCIDADLPVNFDVHLPTLEEPTFSVRDYGTGLAPEDVVGVFSMLGKSTKRNSNKFNGTLGIGRMAGLAVADAFTVESHYNGTLYSYAISMQEGIPVTMHLGDQPTSEPNGVKLSITVEHSDINYFRAIAGEVYKYFDHKPNLNIEGIDIELDVSEHISDDWFVCKNKDPYKKSNYVVMSQVAYEIPYNSSIDDQGFSNLVIKAPTGSVTFNPGRESLSLNKASIDYLNKAFEDVKDEYVQSANNALALATSDAELVKVYNSVVRSAPHSIAGNISLDPFASTNYTSLFSNYSFNSSNSKTFNNLSLTSDFKNITNNLVTIMYKPSYYKTSKLMDRSNIIEYTKFFNGVHVIVDVKSKFRSLLNRRFDNNNLITWQREGKSDLDDAVDEAKNFLEGLGVSYLMASDIIKEMSPEDVGKATAPREGLYSSSIATINNYVHKAEKWEGDLDDQTYLYVKLKNTTPELSDDTYSFPEYCTAYNLLNKIEPMPPIFGVAKKYQGFVEELDNWVDFEDYIKDKVANTTFKKSLESNWYLNDGINSNNVESYPEPIRDYYYGLVKQKDFINSDNYLCVVTDLTLMESMGAPLEEYDPDNVVDINTLKKDYPKTIEFLSSYRYHDTDFLIYLSRLEHNYAVHPPEQQ